MTMRYRTTLVAEKLTGRVPALRHIFLKHNGQGRALRNVRRESSAKIFSYTDVAFSADLSFVPALLDPLADNSADITIGSRLLCPQSTTRGWKREIPPRTYNTALQVFFQVRFTDAQCGFKAISYEATLELLLLTQDEEWFFDTELPL